MTVWLFLWMVLMGLFIVALFNLPTILRWSYARKERRRVAEEYIAQAPAQQLAELVFLHKVSFDVWEILPGRLWRARDANNVHGYGKTEVEAVQDMMRRARERERKQQMVN